MPFGITLIVANLIRHALSHPSQDDVVDKFFPNPRGVPEEHKVEFAKYHAEHKKLYRKIWHGRASQAEIDRDKELYDLASELKVGGISRSLMETANEMGRSEKLDASIQRTVSSIARQANGLAKQVDIRSKMTTAHRAEVVEAASAVANLPVGQSLQEEKKAADPAVVVVGILQNMIPRVMITFKVKTKSGLAVRFGAYASHSDEILRVVSARGKEVTWRLEVISSIKSTVEKALSSSASDGSLQAASPAGSVVEAPLAEQRSEARHARDGILASVAKRRKLDTIDAVRKMSHDDLNAFSQDRVVSIDGADWSYADVLEDNDAYETYVSNGRSDDIFNAWYDRASDLLDGECEPPFRAGF